MTLHLIWQRYGAEFIATQYSILAEIHILNSDQRKRLTAIRVKMREYCNRYYHLTQCTAWVVAVTDSYSLLPSQETEKYITYQNFKWWTSLRVVCVYAISIAIALYLSLWLVSTLLAPFELRVTTTKLPSFKSKATNCATSFYC